MNPPNSSPESSPEDALPPTDVREILQANAAREQPAEVANEPIPREFRRKRRDYWWALLGGNLVFAGFLVLFPSNLFVLLFGLGGMLLYTIALTWIMWVVMGKY